VFKNAGVFFISNKERFFDDGVLIIPTPTNIYPKNGIRKLLYRKSIFIERH